MRAYLAKLSPTARIALAVPLLWVGYLVVMNIVPAILRAAVPGVVRSVLNMM
jgi:hypothetical protein